MPGGGPALDLFVAEPPHLAGAPRKAQRLFKGVLPPGSALDCAKREDRFVSDASVHGGCIVPDPCVSGHPRPRRCPERKPVPRIDGPQNRSKGS
jgi:hypothetical protein